MTDHLHFDVVIVGGGSAGLAAAVAAASEGARVALIENHAFLGGKASGSSVGTVCGFYLRNEEHKLKYASYGFSKKFEERLRQKGNTIPQCNKNGLWFLPYETFDFKKVCDELVEEFKIEVFLHTVLCHVELKNNQIEFIRTISYDREVSFMAPVFIDCTGEAMVSKLGKTQVFECDEYQASAQVFTLTGILPTDQTKLNLLLLREIMKEIEAGNLDSDYQSISIVPGSLINNSVSLKIGIPEIVTNRTNKISSLELMARHRVKVLVDFLNKKVSPFKTAFLSNVASEVGVRTGRRSIGIYELNEDDVLHCRKFSDGVANGSWPIEYWDLGKRVNMKFFEADDYYQIPAGCLRSKKIGNLYFAGRHISATNQAVASARVIGTCLSSGYAAGKLAAGSVNGILVEETIKSIRMEQVDL